MRSFPREVEMHNVAITPRETNREMTNLITTVVKNAPKIFCMRTLDVRNKQMVTVMKRKMLAHPGWGHLPINCWSLRQMRRRMAKKGSKHPLKT
jgi:hypothetical protein